MQDKNGQKKTDLCNRNIFSVLSNFLLLPDQEYFPVGSRAMNPFLELFFKISSHAQIAVELHDILNVLL
jgi:hypothetical protein